jgi:hypothetical protein
MHLTQCDTASANSVNVKTQYQAVQYGVALNECYLYYYVL